MSDREAEYFEIHTLDGDVWKVLTTSGDHDSRGKVLMDESGKTFDTYVLPGDTWDDYDHDRKIAFNHLISFPDPIVLIDANGHVVIFGPSRIARIEGPYSGVIGSFADVMREVFSKNSSDTAISENSDADEVEDSSDAIVKDVFV